MSSPLGAERDLGYMEQALVLAQEAASQGEIPIGALVVNAQGNIIAAASNKTEQLCRQSAHAEMLALTRAGEILNNWRLTGCWLYVTLEPCLMCMGLIYLSRISGVVYGARSPLFGVCLDSSRMASVYKVDTVTIIGGVCTEKASAIVQDFFKKRRSGYDGGE